MYAHKKFCFSLVMSCSLVLALQIFPPVSEATASGFAAPQSVTEHDGHHDFDFEIGSWKTHLRRLIHPLSGSTTWVEYDGTTVVRKVGDGRANLAELSVD